MSEGQRGGGSETGNREPATGNRQPAMPEVDAPPSASGIAGCRLPVPCSLFPVPGRGETMTPTKAAAHSISLVVHGHFYQPPRDNPWTDEVPAEPSAAPFHDWNARIYAECYRANAYARIYGANDRIQAMVNNYARLSFNFGPTLARRIER